MSPRSYRYVGPAEIKRRSHRGSHCIKVTNAADLLPWTDAFLPRGRTHGSIPATFIIDLSEHLWVADRHSEHVACADGQDVVAAGEVFFERAGRNIHVEEITNQSTGYCPEPDCWGIVARVLDRIGLRHPMYFTAVFVFRRCYQCGATNIVKDGVFECAVCQNPLAHAWNYSPAA